MNEPPPPYDPAAGAASAGTSPAPSTSGRVATAPTRPFSNFAATPFVMPAWHSELGDAEFVTGEHAFQAAKAATLDEHARMRLARTPMAAKQVGRRVAREHATRGGHAHRRARQVRRRRSCASSCSAPARRSSPRTPRTRRSGAVAATPAATPARTFSDARSCACATSCERNPDRAAAGRRRAPGTAENLREEVLSRARDPPRQVATNAVPPDNVCLHESLDAADANRRLDGGPRHRVACRACRSSTFVVR